MRHSLTRAPPAPAPGFAEIVGLPEDEEVVGTIWFGTPVDDTKPAPPRRRNMEEVLTYTP